MNLINETSINDNTKLIENNVVSITGKIASDFMFSHEVFGEDFYLFYVLVKRLSNTQDVIPITISERLINIADFPVDKWVNISGHFRSYNKQERNKTKLVLSVFAREFDYVNENTDFKELNKIHLQGYICKTPVYRETPLGREIADLMLAVHRPYGKSDYIPCVVWGRNARYTSMLEIGDQVCIWGRIQSREYNKADEKHTAYEISISKLEK